MPKRPRPHRLEDRSRTKFALILPEAWVYRDKGKDYGIDGEVELFTDDGSATGYIFYVQLKATDRAAGVAPAGVTIELDALAYYRSLDAPVLVVRYNDRDGSFFTRWASTIDPYYAKRKGNKTLTLSFVAEDRWTDSTPKDIREYLAKRRHVANQGIPSPAPMFVSVEVDGFAGAPGQVWASRFRSALEVYSEALVLEREPLLSLVTVTVRPGALKVSAADQFGCIFDNPARLESEPTATELVAEQVVLGVCVIHVQTGNAERAAHIVKAHQLRNALLSNPSAAIEILPSLFRTQLFELAIEIAELLAATESDPRFAVLLHAAMLMRGKGFLPEREASIEKALIRRVDVAVSRKDTQSEAIARYNLGNYYGARAKPRKAIHQYVRALRVDAFYERQSYLFAEMGGVLFDAGHFGCSLNAYEHALILGNVEPRTIALSADAALFAGKYSQGLDFLRRYLSEDSEADPEWLLKLSVLEGAVKWYGEEQQTRQTRLAQELAGMKHESPAAAIQKLEQILRLDLLCGLAWFNLGNAQAEQRDYTQAAFAYTACGLIQRWDVEAWVHAAVCCLASKPIFPPLPLIIRVAYGIHGEAYMTALYARMEHLGWASSMIGQLATIIQPITTAGTKRHEPILRLPDEDGLMRPIEDMVKKHRKGPGSHEA